MPDLGAIFDKFNIYPLLLKYSQTNLTAFGPGTLAFALASLGAPAAADSTREPPTSSCISLFQIGVIAGTLM